MSDDYDFENALASANFDSPLLDYLCDDQPWHDLELFASPSTTTLPLKKTTSEECLTQDMSSTLSFKENTPPLQELPICKDMPMAETLSLSMPGTTSSGNAARVLKRKVPLNKTASTALKRKAEMGELNLLKEDNSRNKVPSTYVVFNLYDDDVISLGDGYYMIKNN